MTKPRDSSKPTAKQLSENSRVQMMEVVDGLVHGRSVRDIAAETGISPSRINRWVNDPEFQEMFAQVESNLIDAIEQRLVENVSDAVERLGPKAVQRVEEALDADKPSYTTKDGTYVEGGPDHGTRLSASKTVLQMGGFGKTAKPAAGGNVIPIEARVRSADVSPAAGD